MCEKMHIKNKRWCSSPFGLVCMQGTGLGQKFEEFGECVVYEMFDYSMLCEES